MATKIQINFNNALPFSGFFLMMRHFKSLGFTKLILRKRTNFHFLEESLRHDDDFQTIKNKVILKKSSSNLQICKKQIIFAQNQNEL